MSAAVEILLSTFDGARYLPAQLESLWAQDHEDLTVVARDDGSRDDTVPMLRRLLAGRGRVVEGERLGAARSFLTLLGEVDPRADYVAFCDQDDVWLPGKVSAALAALADRTGPAMYCSAVELVDENLAHVGIHRRCIRGPSFQNALVENVATGCTIVLNRPAVELLSLALPGAALMHDWWSYLVISGCGQVVYDPRSFVQYRLHDTNTVGVSTTFVDAWRGRVRRQLETGQLRTVTAQVRELERLYGTRLRPPCLREMRAFLAAGDAAGRRLAYVLRNDRAFRQRWTDDMIFRLLYLVNRV